MRLLLVALGFALFIGATAQAGPGLNTGSVIVTIIGLPSDKGRVSFGIYKSEKSFDSYKPFFQKWLDVKNGKSSITVKDILYGFYAVRIYHDENVSGELETNFIGIPKEPVGFSNNHRMTFGPPSYDKAKFMLNQEIMKLEVKASYVL